MIRSKSFAKINLALKILGLQEGGYHEVDMIMQQISLHDEVIIKHSKEFKLNCTVNCPIRQNTAYKAAQLFFSKSGFEPKVEITINKHIPEQSGLGGGSSNAACVLESLNKLFETGYSSEELAELGIRIGMDVPFFLYGGCMRAQGRGERLTPIENVCNPLYLIIKPYGGVSTGRAYELSDSMPQSDVNIDRVIDALETDKPLEFFEYAGNALMWSSYALNPEIEKAVKYSYEYGSEFTMMTGAGSAVFAVFDDEEQMKEAEERLSEIFPFVCETRNHTSDNRFKTDEDL